LNTVKIALIPFFLGVFLTVFLTEFLGFSLHKSDHSPNNVSGETSSGASVRSTRNNNFSKDKKRIKTETNNPELSLVINFDPKDWKETLAYLESEFSGEVSSGDEKIANAFDKAGEMLQSADYQMKGILVEQLLNSLLKFNSPSEVLKWSEENRKLLREDFHIASNKFDSTSYEYMLQKLFEKESDRSEEEKEKISNYPNLQKDLLPHIISQTKIWENLSFEGMNPEETKLVQAKTLNKLAKSFQNDTALRMFFDDGCVIHRDKATVSRVITREWFWENTDAAMETIQNAPPGIGRDTALSRAIELMYEVEPESVKEWIPLIASEEIRSSLNRRSKDDQ